MNFKLITIQEKKKSWLNKKFLIYFYKQKLKLKYSA